MLSIQPTAAPENVRGHNSSSTSVLVTWDDVPAADQNGIILTYTITYESLTEGHRGNVTVDYPARQTTLTGLREYNNYSITVLASTVKGDGPASSPIIVITDQDKPTAAPVNVTGQKSSSTSILVTWGNVPAADQNGIILTYTITYVSLKENHNGTVTVNYLDRQTNLTGLREYVNYSISVFASTVKGDGPASSSIIIITVQKNQPKIIVHPRDTSRPEGDNVTLTCNADGNPEPTISWTRNGSPVDTMVPDPPLNVTVDSKSSRVVNISWVAGFHGNSAIQNYTVKISEDNQTFGDALCQGSLSGSSCVVPSSSTSASLGNLSPFTTYYIKVFARNAVGTSNSSPVVSVTTDEEEPTGLPQDITAEATSPKSISVTWNAVPADQRNGIIKGYKIIYQTLPSGSNITERINATGANEQQTTTLDQLNEFTNYSIRMLAFTSKGDGPLSAAKVVQTQEDKPDGAPQNVTGQHNGSTSILVMWDDVPADKQNGIITGYTITYHSQTENDNGSVPAGPNDRQQELTNLQEYVNYNITVFASTVIGPGPDSDPGIVVRTDQDKPDGAPQNVTGQHSGSTSILVTWDDVPADKQNGIITGYTITYHSQTENDNGSVPVGPNERQQELTNLQEYVNYNITVFASTVIGPGPDSDPGIVVRTDQDKPDGAPQNVTGQNSSSTSILVMWDDVPADKQNGIITGYTITYHSQTENDNGSVPAGPNERQQELTNLQEYVNYNITVFASTVKGAGPDSDPGIVVRTDQDKPDGAPQNVTGQNSSSTSILVMWDEVPADQQNGIITGYTITYHSQTENDNGSVPAGPNERQQELTNLQEYVNYNITVFASTVKGPGPDSDPGIVVRTDQDKPDGAPQNVTGQHNGSTSILVMWDDVPADKQNGIITGYTITYHSQTENDNGSVPAGPNERQQELTNLQEYVNYNITVFASTVKGAGPDSDPVIVVRTDQDKPDGAPQNVTGQHSSSTSILVMWDEVPADQQNGIITGYTITYHSQTENDNGSVPVGPNERQQELTNLQEYVNYNITVFASTVKGAGPDSDPVIFVRTDQDKPDGAPQNVTGQNSSSTSILVMWDEVPADQQNGIITGYTITYHSQTENDNGSVPAGPNDRQQELTNLQEYVNYNITVFASTVIGPGPDSDPGIVVRTDQDKPDGAPQNVTGQNSSSTSILVMWDDVPADKQNGIITGYTITYHSQTENDNGSVPVGPNERQQELTNLKEYVNYNITVFASTVKGAGPDSDPGIVVRTDQDKPDGAPQNVTGQNSSSTSILVMWDDVPADKQNGIITGYTITYHSQTENDNGSVPAGPNERQQELTNLQEYVNYNITVFASTVKGAGPDSDPVIVVRTDQDSKYVIHYTDEKENKTKDVTAPALKAVVNGLRQSTTYSFRVLAATVKGVGPASDPKSGTTDGKDIK
ncbi:protein sidekick-1-like [Oculina patagonica]